MADDDRDMTTGSETPERKRKRRWAKRAGWALAILLTPLLLAAAFLASPIGKRFVADQIAQVSPASGLRFEVGRIEGDLYGEATLHDVVVKDPKGVFLTIPVVELDWRPLAWLWSGLDVRELAIRRGTLERMPELLPGDPDAPLLPDFDIRIDRFEIERLMLARGVAGERAQRVDFLAEVDIRDGRALVDAEGRFGPEDKIELLLDAEPDGDRFDLALDYFAAEDGPIAAIAGLDSAYRARVEGDGTWSRWLGHALLTKRTGDDDTAYETLAAFQVSNIAGEYGLLGQYYPLMDEGGIVDRALGEAVSLALSGTLEESVFDGGARAVTTALDLRGEGILDLADNAAEDFDLRLDLRDPDLLGETARFEGAQLAATIDGAFRDLTIDHRLAIDTVAVGDTVTIRNLVQDATATWDGTRFTLPLDAEVARVVTGSGYVDPRLVNGTLRGTLTYTGDRLLTDRVRIDFPGLDARLALRGDLSTGEYRIAGPVGAQGIAIENVGQVSGTGDIDVRFGSGPWSLTADLDGRLANVSNETIANLAGERIAFSGQLNMGGDRPIALNDVVIDGARLDARLDSRIEGGTTILAGSGEHVEYGSFTFDGVIDGEGPRGELVLANPLPAAELSDVRIALAPSERGFDIDVSGGSLLGPFEGELGLALPGGGAPARVDIDRLRVYRTNVTGALTLGDDGIVGDLALSGGGLDGTVSIAPGPGDAQRFDADLRARNASFGGATTIALGRADIDASGTFGGPNGLTVDANVDGSDLQYGALTIAAFNADAEIANGSGELTAAIAGRRQDRFSLKLAGDFSPQRIAVIAQGQYAGRDITMPRRAVLTPIESGGYRLAPTQIGYAGGFTILEGRVGGSDTAFEAKLARMPLRLADIAGADLGLGGRLSGVIEWNQRGNALPVGNARVKIDDFTRSGLVLSSRPIDVYAVADLRPDRLVAGARLRDGESELGRFNARITGLPSAGDLATRLGRGRLSASLRYDGAAESLWRLAAIETFDLTGPLRVEARATGTLNNPRIVGNLASDDLRLQSAISGTDIDDVTARGRFAGSRLEIQRFAGTTAGGGTVSGSGIVDLGTIGAGRGPRIDLRAAADEARLLNANGLDATLTGPLRIVSDGRGGTIAGRVVINEASWSLGTADEDRALPQIATREINGEGPTATATDPASSSWRYLVDARARSRISVDGLGLESEWGVDIALRGTVDDPRIGGEARLVRGDYTFAGTRFELTRGRIAFDRDEPINPRLDIEAETTAAGTDVTIDITGNAQQPQIAFSSTPALPEEEILARLLFGGSVTSLSATDALQLGAALASLQGGGGGLDPIGELRDSIGLDQLRIVSADPALGRGTGVALGKNLGSRVYVELVTDGQGYTATQVEYRITRWLALLATVTTIGRDSALVEISRDY